MRLALAAPLRPDHPVWQLEGTSLRIGRAGENAIRINEGGVSREHAEIVLREGRLFLSDLRSHNGTWLNGARLRRPAEIHEGDRIQVGRVELRVIRDPGDPPTDGDVDSALSTLTYAPAALPFGGRLGSDERSRETIRRIETFARILAKHQTLRGAIESLLCAVEDALPAKRVTFMMRRDGDSEPVIVAARPRIPCLASPPVVSLDDLRGILERRAPLLLPSAGARAIAAPHPPSRGAAHHALAVPLAQEGRAIGLLYAEHRGLDRGYGKEHLEIAILFAGMAASRIASGRMTEAGAVKSGFDHDLVVAGQIQRWLLPSHETRIAGYDIHARLEPCEAVGGDFYDFHTDANGDVWILLGDVAGKGICGAIVMSTVVSSARVLYDECRDPLALAQRLNAVLQGQAEYGMYVTAFVGRLDPDEGVLEYVNAGQTYPRLIRGRRMAVLDRSGQPLGISPDYPYQLESLRLQPGGLLAIYSDGVPDELRDRRHFFGEGRVAKALRAGVRCERLEDAARLVFRSVDEFLAGHARLDDMTLLLLRRHS